MTTEQLVLFCERAPHRPYCTDDLAAGLSIRSKQDALKRRYVQHNPPSQLAWIVLDVDHPGAIELAVQNGPTPEPNMAVYNPTNGHAHVFYALNAPVTTSANGRHGPIRYAAAIEAALKRLYEADNGYVGLISKNPTHQSWKTNALRAEPYDLAELAEWLDISSDTKLTRPAKRTGLGRNCTLFDTARKWAYRAVLQHRIAGNADTFCDAVLTTCLRINSAFSPALPLSEVRATAKSISKWTWRHYTGRKSDAQWAQYVTATHTPEIQAKRGRAGGKAKGLRNAEKRSEAVLMRAKGMTQTAISEALGVSQASVCSWLKASA